MALICGTFSSFLSNVVPAGASQALLGTKRPFEGYTWEVFLLVGVLSHRVRGEIATPFLNRLWVVFCFSISMGKYWGCYDRFWMMFIVVVVCFLLRQQIDQKSTTMSIFCFREVIINSLMSLAPWSAELLDEIQHGTFLMSRWRRPRIGRGKSGGKIKGKCCMLDLILGHPNPFMKCMNLSSWWISPWFRLVCDGGSSSVWRSSGAWAV